MTVPVTSDLAPALLVGCCVVVADVVARGRAPTARLERVVGQVVDGTAGDAVPTRRRDPWVARIRRVVARDRRDDEATVRALVESWGRGLRAGGSVPTAFADAVAEVPHAPAVVPRAHSAAALGGDLPSALRSDAARLAPPARRGALAASACASVAQHEGARLADALDHLADALRADEQHRAHVRAQLAAPRATARLLAALPLVAVVMASGAGIDAVGVIVHDGWGRAAVAAAALLDAVGLWWTARIVTAAERAS